MKNNPSKIVLAAGFVLALAFAFSCSSDLEMPPPPDPDYLSDVDQSSSSSLGGDSSNSAGTGGSSSATEAGTSSSAGTGGTSSAASGGGSSDSQELNLSSSLGGIGGNSSSGVQQEYSSSSTTWSSSSVASSSSVTPSSSSVVQSSSSVDLCTGFVNGTKIEHYGMEKEQFCDSRDGKKYVYVTIGTQTWMAENLNYATDDSKCYLNQEIFCDIYGKLYNWETAANCPFGWHLPSNAELVALMTAVGGSSTSGTKLKSASGWKSLYDGPPLGTDNYGFSALPSGWGSSSDNFGAVGDYGFWWSASENAAKASFWVMGYSQEDIQNYDDGSKSSLHSVRCVQD